MRANRSAARQSSDRPKGKQVRVQVPYSTFVPDVESLRRGVKVDVFTGVDPPPATLADAQFYVLPYRRMMTPVVFFILPVTMLFALFPGFVSLRLLA
jgi:hypothetical protein